MNAPAAAPILAATGLVVQIGQRDVCCGLDLALNPGECLAILGRYGAGKSTLLSTLAGLRGPVAGEVRLMGRSYAELGPREAACRRGWLGQHRGDLFASSVLETVLAGRHPHLGRWEWESAGDAKLARLALQEVGLAGMESRDIQTLSGGERQRLAIATLLTQAPALYLLDEPLAHLDLNHQIAVLDLFAARARAGAAVVMVLHEPALAWRYCQRILVIHGDGRSDCGDRADMLTAERLSRLYGHPLQVVDVDGQRAFLPQ